MIKKYVNIIFSFGQYFLQILLTISTMLSGNLFPYIGWITLVRYIDFLEDVYQTVKTSVASIYLENNA